MLEKRFRRLRWLCGVLAFLMLWCGLPLDAKALSATSDQRKTVLPSGLVFQRELDLAQALDNILSRDTFDSTAVIAKVGKDPVKLFEWVRDNTWWVPYQGCLRGSTGVLMDRIGSSLDRSLLLAELLRQSGYPVRLAHSQLDEATAGRLLESIRSYPGLSVVPTMGMTWEELREQTEKFARQFNLNTVDVLRQFDYTKRAEDSIVEEIAAKTPECSLALLGMMPQNPLGNAASQRSDAVNAIRDHWWVRCQQKGGWVDLDPLLPNAKFGSSITKPAETLVVNTRDGAVDLKAKWRHEVVVRVEIEQYQNGKTIRKSVFNTTLRPMDILGQPVTIAHIAPEWPRSIQLSNKTAPMTLRKTILDQRQWMPVIIIGKQQIVKQGFDDTGEVIEQSRFGAQEEMGKSVAKTMSGFGGFLSDEGEGGETGGMLTGEWLVYEIRTPGKPVQVVRREVFDLIGPVARAKKMPVSFQVSEKQQIQRCLQLLSPIRALFTVGKPSDEYVDHLFYRDVQSARSAIRDDGKIDHAQLLEVLALTSVPDAILYDWARKRWQGVPNPMTYQDRINIANVRVNYTLDEGSRIGVGVCFDIVANYVAVCAIASDRAFSARLTQGVADTVAEQACLSGGDPLQNTAGLHSFMQTQGNAPVLVKASSDSALASLHLTPESRARIQEDVASGSLAVVCAGGDGISPHSGWWRINPDTGETVGRMESGYNQGWELILLFALLIIAGIAAVKYLLNSETVKCTQTLGQVCEQEKQQEGKQANSDIEPWDAEKAKKAATKRKNLSNSFNNTSNYN